jgi:hypothetical protein
MLYIVFDICLPRAEICCFRLMWENSQRDFRADAFSQNGESSIAHDFLCGQNVAFVGAPKDGMESRETHD